MGEEPVSPPSSPDEPSAPAAAPQKVEGSNNLLSKEFSSFLRRHANDKIEWRPWGRDAIVEAAESDKPILLSVGFFLLILVSSATR